MKYRSHNLYKHNLAIRQGCANKSFGIFFAVVISAAGCSTISQKIVSTDVALPIANRHLCLTCHSVDKKNVAPSFKDIAEKYRGQDAQQKLYATVRFGGPSRWGVISMPPFPNIPVNDLRILVQWITQQPSASSKSGDLFDKHDEAMGLYSESILKKIASKSLTKEEIKLNDFGGKGMFTLVILANGNLESVGVRKSTGSRNADKEMAKRIMSASPFHPPTSPLGNLKNVVIDGWFSYPKIISDGMRKVGFYGQAS